MTPLLLLELLLLLKGGINKAAGRGGCGLEQIRVGLWLVLLLLGGLVLLLLLLLVNGLEVLDGRGWLLVVGGGW